MPRPRDAPPPFRRGVLERGSAGYPELLETVPDPPAALYWAGDPALLGRAAVAVVGARRSTRTGIRMAETLAAALADAGVVVVSGCAYGVDAAAHRGALEVGGTTVAVLAGGLDVSIVRGNRRLADGIARRGCLVTEWPDETSPQKWGFPWRNRIIAGLARITVVVEAGAKSGALSTAGHALAAGREVMAVPGHPLDEAYAGTVQLIVDGATPIRSAADVLAELVELPGVAEAMARYSAAAEPDPPTPGPLAPVDARVLDAIGHAPASLDAVAERVGVPVPTLLAALTRLELLGVVRVDPGPIYRRAAVIAADSGRKRK